MLPSISGHTGARRGPLPSVRELFPEQYRCFPDRGHAIEQAGGGHRLPPRHQQSPQRDYAIPPVDTTNINLTRRASPCETPVVTAARTRAHRASAVPAEIQRIECDLEVATTPRRTTSLSFDSRLLLPKPTRLPHAQREARYSFGVLRTDPANSSLEHVASSTKLEDLAPHQNTGSGIPCASVAVARAAPSFRVAVQPPAPTLSRPEKNYRMLVAVDETSSNNTGIVGRRPSVELAHNAESSDPSPSSISTPSSGSYTYTFDLSASTTFHPLPLSPEPERGSATRTGGKKHTCRICLKRFNRPSSLKIHETTHTGIKPFKCHWEGCGRLFNVNSNMRRHFRNHFTSQRAKVLRATSQAGALSLYVHDVSSRLHMQPSPHAEDEREASLVADTGTEPESEDDDMDTEEDIEDERTANFRTSPRSVISSPPFLRTSHRSFETKHFYDTLEEDGKLCHAYSTSYNRAQSHPHSQVSFARTSMLSVSRSPSPCSSYGSSRERMSPMSHLGNLTE